MYFLANLKKKLKVDEEEILTSLPQRNIKDLNQIIADLNIDTELLEEVVSELDLAVIREKCDSEFDVKTNYFKSNNLIVSFSD